ncbi:phage tail sheath family protein [Peptoniphilus harei]|uniref:phage tail sheath family protein n=1 Tax=Peptoniphilus harei TaxID=54005 RepID=UPI0011DCE6C5|nr:phage tail sheath family protein [Peptoniphilus harei]
MALGGGNFLVENKILPGTDINFVSLDRPSNIFSDRGYAAIGMDLDWGSDGITTIESSDLQRESLELLGYSYTDDKLKAIREIMLHAKTLYLGRLNKGGEKAKGVLGSLNITAKYAGIRGNDIQVEIDSDIDNEGYYKVLIKFGDIKAYNKTVKDIKELEENKFVDFKGSISETGQVKLANGTNGTANGQAHSDFLEEIEKYYFNTIAYAGTDKQTKGLYREFVKRLRDDEGVKCVAVLYKEAANYEGVINVTSKALEDEVALVYWLLGASAGAEINESLTNFKYDGDYTLDTNYKQRELKEAIKKGEFVFHKVGEDVRALRDINSFTEFTKKKNDDFSSNQVIRVLDQLAIDVAKIFNERYVGKVQNNKDGRISFWKDIVFQAETMQRLGAIEDFDSEDIKVMRGFSKKAVATEYLIKPVAAMEQLYMVVTVG